LEQIGEGGMGQVYKALDLRLQRAVALKFLSPALIENEKALARFQLEAVAASAINHPNICTIYDVKIVPPHHFIVMEYIDGLTLRDILHQQGRLSEWDVAWIIEQICPPFGLAHEAGIVHRDIKPDNILVVTEPPHVKITDFGLAKLAAEAAEIKTAFAPSGTFPDKSFEPVFSPGLMVTTLSGMMGTISYMSPEQVKKTPVDFRADIFSIGAMLYELLSGVRLFDGANQREVLERIASFDDVKPAATKAGISHGWLPILNLCLRNDPDLRYQSVNALLEDVSRLKGRLQPTNALYGDKTAVTSRRRDRIVKWLILPIMLAIIFVLSVFGARQWQASFTSTPDAIAALPDSIDVTTHSAEAYHYFIKGRKAWWRYHSSSAIENLQIAVEMDTSFSYAYCLLGLLCNWVDRQQESAACFQKSLYNFEQLTAWEKMLVRGFQYYSRDESEAMLAQFERLVSQYPHVIDGYLGAMLACEKLDEYDRAIDFGLRLLKINSTHIAAHNNLADLYHWKGDFDKTLHHAEKQLQLILDSGDLNGITSAYEWVGRSHHMLGHAQEAEENLKKALVYDPQNQDASEILAEVLVLQAKLAEAEKTIKTAMSMPMKQLARVRWYYRLARLYVFMGRFTESIESYGKAKSIFEELEETVVVIRISHELSELYFELGRLNLIDIEMDYLAKMAPQSYLDESHIYIYWQASLAISRENFLTAEAWMARAHTLSNELWSDLEIDYLIAQQNFQQASQRLITQVENHPINIDDGGINYYHKSARLLLEENKLVEALHICLLALETRRLLARVNIGIYYMKSLALLAEIYEKMGDKDKALAQCERFLLYWQNADPGSPLLLEVQERVERLQKQVADS
ncbi:protein kinase, partial [candidate division KSB1 bacterium]|nr:protein kinase [candidate division KSB1 bacterium]